MPSSKFLLRTRDRARLIRWTLGILLLLNIAAAALVMYPPGGNALDLEEQLARLQSQVTLKRGEVARIRQHVASVEQGRNDGDRFLNDQFLARRVAYSTVLAELGEAARSAKVKERENTFAAEPIEGSDALSMMTITANYEGAYQDVMNFVREIDQSPRLLIIESLNAAPQAGNNTLNVSLKIEAFLREDGSLLPASEAPAKTVALNGGAR